MKLTLPNSISSQQDLAALINEIKQYEKWWTHNDIKLRVHAAKGTPPPVLSEGALQMVRAASGGKLLNRTALDLLLRELDAYHRTSKTMTLTLAAPAPKSTRAVLVEWCRANIDPSILVNFEFNSTLCGGMVVRYGSHVFDWSFRRQILASRGNFPEVLRRV